MFAADYTIDYTGYMTDMETIPAKTILGRAKGGAWFGVDYNMNIYRGCSHGCIYCDSRSDCYGNTTFDQVRAKENAIHLLRRELPAKQSKGVVATGAMSDPYNPYEEHQLLTRQALALLAEFGFGVAIATKGTLVTRDMDLLQSIARRMPVLVKITITTAEDRLCRMIEPAAPLSSQRFAAIEALSQSGIYTGVLLMPTLPYITDTVENVEEIVALAKAAGAKFVFPAFGMTLRDTQREYYYRKLDEHFPGLSRRYRQQYGDAYGCGSPAGKQLQAAFSKACHTHNIQYKMKDIIDGYQKDYRQTQISLFDI